jgi:hypothetical protein
MTNLQLHDNDRTGVFKGVTHGNILNEDYDYSNDDKGSMRMNNFKYFMEKLQKYLNRKEVTLQEMYDGKSSGYNKSSYYKPTE